MHAYAYIVLLGIAVDPDRAVLHFSLTSALSLFYFASTLRHPVESSRDPKLALDS